MPGIAEIALAGAPIAGGALLGIAAGNMRGPDVRALIKQDMELLAMLPAEQVERRAELQRVIDIRIDDIIAGVDKSRSLLEIAQSYRGNWRDIVVFICAILFTIIWWNVSHSRSNWLVDVHRDDRGVGRGGRIRRPRNSERDTVIRPTPRRSVVVGVRRRGHVIRVIRVVAEVRRVDAVRLRQIQDLGGAGDAG